MKIIGTQIIGDMIVESDTQYNNVLAENIMVSEKVIARFYGVIKETITVKQNATAYVHGRIDGKVINEGGIVYLFNPNGQVETF